MSGTTNRPFIINTPVANSKKLIEVRTIKRKYMEQLPVVSAGKRMPSTQITVIGTVNGGGMVVLRDDTTGHIWKCHHSVFAAYLMSKCDPANAVPALKQAVDTIGTYPQLFED